MKPIYSYIILGLCSLLLLAAVALFNVIWALILLGAGSVVLILAVFFVGRHWWVKWGLIVVLAIIPPVALWLKLLPIPSEPGSAAETTIPILDSIMPAPPVGKLGAGTDRSLDLVAAAKQRFLENYYFERRQRLTHIENAAAIAQHARQFLIRTREKRIGTNQSWQNLDDAIIELDNSIKPHHDEIKDRIGQIRNFLDDSREHVESLRDTPEIREYLAEFARQYGSINLDDIYENVTQVREAIRSILGERVTERVKVKIDYRAILDEEANTLHLDEIITVVMDKPIVRIVDLASLVEATEYGDFQTSLFLSYQVDCEIETQLKHDWFEPSREKKAFCVIHRITMPPNFVSLGPPQRLANFRAFNLTWPALYKADVGFDLDLSDEGLPETVGYSFELERGKNPIKFIDLPPYAFFQSTPPMVAITLDDRDRIQSEKLTPANFRSINPVWIELQPNSRLFRNKLVQDNKQYLVTENAVAAIILACFGGILGLFWKRTKPAEAEDGD